jgi:hypothetical protein
VIGPIPNDLYAPPLDNKEGKTEDSKTNAQKSEFKREDGTGNFLLSYPPKKNWNSTKNYTTVATNRNI